MALHEATVEKEKLEREKQKLKLLFKQKKLEANELEQKIHGGKILFFIITFLLFQIHGQVGIISIVQYISQLP
jgi:hypothetical protein